ncbi:MAG: Tn3 family transposase [Myxococcales bacterium]|nr:Tn3 family transposase [Myxococcales bacterium]
MPVEFLTDEQANKYGAFSGALSRKDLERFFFLDDEDRRLIDRRRRDHNRLGFGLQVGTVRMLGCFLDEPTKVPAAVVNYVAQQLGIDAAACVQAYGDRPQTVLEHAWEIRSAYGYREFSPAQAELSSWLDARAWTTGEGPKALFDASVEWLLRHKVLLPRVTTLTRFVAKVREQAAARLCATLAALPTAAQKRTLDDLLAVDDSTTVSRLERLRRGPTRVSGTQLKNALTRVAEVSEIGFKGFECSSVPPRRLAELARYGFASKASHLRRHPPDRRHATMLATTIRLYDRSVDDALDVFDAMMATKLVARVNRETRSDRTKAFPRLALASSKLAAAIRILQSADQETPVSEVWERIDQAVSCDELDAALTTVVSMAPSHDSDLDEEWRSKLAARYRTVTPFLEALVSGIEFGATAGGERILAALKQLPGLLGRKKVRPEEIDSDILVGSWRRLVLAAPHLEPGAIDWRAYVLCVLEQFWRHLLRREVYALHSTRWSDPRAQLLSGDDWERARPTVLASLDLPEEPAEHLAERARMLDESYRHVAERLEGNGSVTVDDEGRLHFEALTAEPESASLIALRTAVERMLPRVDLPEVLLEVATWSGYHEAFTPVGGGSRMKDQELSIAALLVAKACNIGFSPVVKNSVPALRRARLSHLDQNYLRVETIKQANRALIEAQSDIPLARLWGGGHVASVDGMRFVVPVATVHARPNPRYFGRGTGATWLNMINDQASGLAAKVVAGTPRDSLHVLDVVHDQDGGIRPEMIVTDTASYSDVVFGLLTLCGYQYAPQLADLPDQKLWRIDSAADYGPFDTAARGRITLDKIAHHWPDILRVVSSIHAGTVCSHDVIRMLQHDGRSTPLGDALAHYGRIYKSLHVLRLADDRSYRRQIKAQANLQEGRHDLARRIFHGERGELRQRYRDRMENQLGALGLVLNVIVLFNTRYIDAALNRLRAEGYPVQDSDAARLSPFVREHLNIQGKYTFIQPDLGGGLRELRDPRRAADDET